MKQITVKRYCKHRTPTPSIDATYSLPQKVKFLLDALDFIKEEIDPSLTYSHGCRSGICGSCAVRVNGKEQLACKYKLESNDHIEALDKLPIIKDLVVDQERALESLKRAHTFFQPPANSAQSPQELERIETQSDCILCASCFSACPVLEVDSAFLGPFALTRAYRYINDSRIDNAQTTIDAIQTKGVWNCTLCGECTLVCPQGIDPKNDILMLRTKSVQAGYSDPTFGSGGGDDFLSGGLDPNF